MDTNEPPAEPLDSSTSGHSQDVQASPKDTHPVLSDSGDVDMSQDAGFGSVGSVGDNEDTTIASIDSIYDTDEASESNDEDLFIVSYIHRRRLNT